MKEETTPASVDKARTFLEDLIKKYAYGTSGLNKLPYVLYDAVAKIMAEYGQAKDKEIEALKNELEGNSEIREGLEILLDAAKRANEIISGELKYYRELAGDLLKICEMVHVPQILREYPHVLAGKPTNKDIQWAKEKIEALKNQKPE